MSEASLRQPCMRIDCVFRDTPLDSGDAPPLKLSRPGAVHWQARHGTKRACVELLRSSLPPTNFHGRKPPDVINR